jgi:drug/metabolite transporter (DMT)-like permease
MSMGLAIVLGLVTAACWAGWVIPLKLKGPQGMTPRFFNFLTAVGLFIFSTIWTLVSQPGAMGYVMSNLAGQIWAGMLMGVMLIFAIDFGLNAIGKMGLARAIGVWNISGVFSAAIAVFVFGEMAGAPGGLIALLILGVIIIIIGGVTVAWSGVIQERAQRSGVAAVSEPMEPTIDVKSGVAYALIAAIFFTVFSLTTSFAPEFSLKYPTVFFWWASIGAIIAAVVAGFVGDGGNFIPSFKVPAGFYSWGIAGGLIWSLGYLLFLTIIPVVGVSVAFPLALVNTLFGAIYGVIWFKELAGAPAKAHKFLWGGAVIVVLGVFVLSTARGMA